VVIVDVAAVTAAGAIKIDCDGDESRNIMTLYFHHQA
jgi:hypothetical protein